MNCEWHGDRHPATWWAETIYGPLSWCCDAALQRVGKKDEDGKFIAIPAAERMAQIHPGAPGAGEGGQK